MAKKSKRTLDKADMKRTVTCSFCGGEHRRRSKELTECRRTRGDTANIGVADKTKPTRRAGSEVTRYANDPVGGNPLAHAARKYAKAGWPARKIAKTLNRNLNEVRAWIDA